VVKKTWKKDKAWEGMTLQEGTLPAKEGIIEPQKHWALAVKNIRSVKKLKEATAAVGAGYSQQGPD